MSIKNTALFRPVIERHFIWWSSNQNKWREVSQTKWKVKLNKDKSQFKWKWEAKKIGQYIMPSPMKENYYILISLIAKLETSSSILFLSILFKRWKDNIRFKACNSNNKPKKAA